MSFAMKLEPVQTKDELRSLRHNEANVLASELIEHMGKTDGLYLAGWELDFLKSLHRERVLEDNFNLTEREMKLVNEIHSRIEIMGHFR